MKSENTSSIMEEDRNTSSARESKRYAHFFHLSYSVSRTGRNWQPNMLSHKVNGITDHLLLRMWKVAMISSFNVLTLVFCFIECNNYFLTGLFIAGFVH